MRSLLPFGYRAYPKPLYLSRPASVPSPSTLMIIQPRASHLGMEHQEHLLHSTRPVQICQNSASFERPPTKLQGIILLLGQCLRPGYIFGAWMAGWVVFVRGLRDQDSPCNHLQTDSLDYTTRARSRITMLRSPTFIVNDLEPLLLPGTDLRINTCYPGRYPSRIAPVQNATSPGAFPWPGGGGV